MKDMMIKADEISFAYPGGEEIISDFSYEFSANKSYIICGENGCGKTTITRLLLGLLKPDSGKIEKSDGAVISYVPDNNGMYENLTLKDNILSTWPNKRILEKEVVFLHLIVMQFF